MIIFRRFWFSLAMCAATCGACADEPQLHALWVIEGQSNRVYLAGSVHAMRQQDYPLPTIYHEVYNDAENIVLETRLSNLDPTDIARMSHELAQLPQQQSLESVLGNERYRAFNQRARALNIDLRQFKHFESWFAAITITQIQMQRLGYDASRGLDVYYSNKAATDNKGESGLETFEQQLRFFDDLSIDAQIELLDESLSSVKQLRQQAEALMQAWKNGELDKLQSLFENTMLNDPELRRVLLTTRNKTWLPQIIKLLGQPDDYLVIAGALHMIGNDGLVKLLEQAGYSVRQL